MRLSPEHHPRYKKRLREHSDPDLELLYYLYRDKRIPPWEVYRQAQGARDLIEAFALFEVEQRDDG